MLCEEWDGINAECVVLVSKLLPRGYNCPTNKARELQRCYFVSLFTCKPKPITQTQPTKNDNCAEDDECCKILGESFISKVNENILKPLKIVAPILLLVLTTIDFAKIVYSENDKDGMPKAWRNFLKRAIATLIIFFASNIISIIFGFIQCGIFCSFG